MPVLQPVLSLFAFFLVLPGRDAQDVLFMLDQDFWCRLVQVPLMFLCPALDVLLPALLSVFCTFQILLSLFFGGIHQHWGK